jgi:hypothetical protein
MSSTDTPHTPGPSLTSEETDRLAELRAILAEDPWLSSVTDEDEIRRELADLELKALGNTE